MEQKPDDLWQYRTMECERKIETLERTVTALKDTLNSLEIRAGQLIQAYERENIDSSEYSQAIRVGLILLAVSTILGGLVFPLIIKAVFH